jgi:predicted Zn-ribbon and HTH transcriptional regulator
MFGYTQVILKQLLAAKSTTPERLTDHERAIAERICLCAVCEYLWVRKLQKTPERCPKCHAYNWNRPLLTAMLAAENAKATAAQSQDEGKAKP